ncbi:Inhibitor of growth protein [Dirofilaria immitis]|nr:Inhibitor of growth protein [Dirofilaria immitis]
MSLLLDHYLDNLSTLPRDLAKNLQGIRKYDMECHKRSAEIDRKLRVFVKSHQKCRKMHQFRLIRKLWQALFAEIERLSNEKIRLASDAYELVDKHIRRLDNDSVKLQATIRQKYLDAAAAAAAKANKSSDETLDRKRKNVASRKDKKKLKEDGWSQKSAASTSTSFQPFLDAPSVMEMPVDPNEPTYCICHQVSHGQMIMCDNKQCPIEWFHFQCVGLMEAPKGKWYCERCNEQRKKNSTGNNK